MSAIQKVGITIFIFFAIGGGTIALYAYKYDGTENGHSKNAGVEITGSETSNRLDQAVSVSMDYSSAATTEDKRFELLEAKIDELQSRLDAIEGKPVSDPLLSEEQLLQPNFASNFRQGPGSMTTNLIAVGIDPLIAEQIEQKRNELELARLVLRDKATRGGYLDKDQYQEELSDLNEGETSIREEIGDNYYDQFLYTSGQANRVSISSVMTGSAAEGAGIRDGDLLVSYAGQRLFRWQELRGITTAGVSGEIVDVRVIRDGNEISLNMPRGPLGVRLSQKRVDPDPSKG